MAASGDIIGGMAHIMTLDSDTAGRWKDMSKWSWSRSKLSYTTIPNHKNSSGIEVALPSGLTEAWLEYQVFFPDGFDFGRNEKAHSVGGKMPGLGCRGRHATVSGPHTGGNHDRYGWSARLMWRGINTKGRSWEPADEIGLELYAYDLEMALNNSIRYGRRLAFRRDGKVLNPPRHAFDGDNNGTSLARIGDPGQLQIPTDQWITITLGHKVGDEAFFKAFVDVGDGAQLVLHLEGDGFRWSDPNGRQEIDTLLFQSHWGGNTELWMPNSRTTFSYNDVSVYDSNPLEQTPVDNSPPIIVTPEPEPEEEVNPIEAIEATLEGFSVAEKAQILGHVLTRMR